MDTRMVKNGLEICTCEWINEVLSLLSSLLTLSAGQFLNLGDALNNEDIWFALLSRIN